MNSLGNVHGFQFNKEVRINGKAIGDGQPTYFLMDLGAKYYPLPVMKKMIKAAKDAGADAIKLQTYKPQTASLRQGSFYRGEGQPEEDQYEFFEKYQLSDEDHKILFAYAKEIGITMFSTPCHKKDADFLDELGVPVFKIASGWATNIPFLEHIAKKGKPMILSTGMTTLAEIYESVEAIAKTGNRQLIILHCITDYPSKLENANLRVMNTLKSAFECPVGFSDHTVGTTASLLATALGACFIEKHFCLDRSAKGPDSALALEPQELEQLVADARLIPTALGTGSRYIFPCEEKWAKPSRMSVVATKDIKRGEKITESMIDILRPWGGLAPKTWDDIIGGTALTDIKQGTQIQKGTILPGTSE